MAKRKPISNGEGNALIILVIIPLIALAILYPVPFIIIAIIVGILLRQWSRKHKEKREQQRKDWLL